VQGYGQWSTATHTDSSLYVCPGFYSGIQTHGDGSSIILGVLDSYFFAQKLDPYGYKLWSSPVQTMHNEGSVITWLEQPFAKNSGGWVSDGDGGIIFFWYDHRDAVQDSNSGIYENNSLYAQRVDKYGTVQWGINGLLPSEAKKGIKTAAIANDDSGGSVFCWSENGYGYPGATNVGKMAIARISVVGNELWRRTIDSNTAAQTYVVHTLTTIGTYSIAHTTVGNIVYDFQGNRINQNYFPNSGPFVSDGDTCVYQVIFPGTRTDSVGIAYLRFRITKYGKNLDGLENRRSNGNT
jgi:hypothetical protein